jgi:methylated-DNA-[protein]-cysteine S-methyltransferase
MLYYAVFRTKWGYFGVAGNGAVRRTCLPMPQREGVEKELSEALRPADGNPRFDKTYLRNLQQRIIAYFEGEPVDFTFDPAVSLDHAGVFARQVLHACRQIGLGRTTTYAGLAARIGRPGAARAVGTALAANPIPLIIPCHRVLRSDGGLGGFSAPGGTATKQKLLDHEESLRPPTA